MEQSSIDKWGSNRGYIIPFVLFIGGLIFFFMIPTDKTEMKNYTGVVSFVSDDYSYFRLKGDKEKRTFTIHKKYQEQVSNKLQKELRVTFGIGKCFFLYKNSVLYLSVENEELISYDYFWHVIPDFVFVIIGALLIPIVVKERNKEVKQGKYDPSIVAKIWKMLKNYQKPHAKEND